MKALVVADVQDGAVVVVPSDARQVLAVHVPFFDGAFVARLLDGGIRMTATREDVGVVRLFFHPPPAAWKEDETFFQISCPPGFVALIEAFRPPNMPFPEEQGISCWITTFRDNQPDDTEFDFEVRMRS